MPNLKYFSMFSGIGGFERGIEQAGANAECVGYSEIDKYAIKVYGRNFGRYESCNEHAHISEKPKQEERTQGREWSTDQQGLQLHNRNGATPLCNRCKGHTNYGDATKINPTELPDFDLLVGGFPCQAFSIAGKRKGFDDTRGTLFFDIARIAREKQPMYMLLENVKGLISHDGGKTLEVILENLQDMGYYVNYEVHNSKDYGVPQNRERIYLLCRHAKLLEELGQNKKPIISKQIITEYLFQLLLNNLAEVRKLQETNSKEWVLGYLLSKEINQSLKSSDESIKAGITTLTDGSIFLLKDEELWQNIDTWLSKNLADGSNELSMSTILTAIRRITTSTTYTFSTMQQLIWLAIVALKKSQPNLWQKVLSDLILIKEDTKYARINNKKEEIIVTETGTAHITTNFQDYGERFIVGHLRGECSGEVFPITGKGGNDTRVVGKEVARTIEASYYKGVSPNGHQGAGRQLIHQLNQPTHSNDRVYGTDGLKVSDDIKIRRLTPTECELLQGFPDSWTALGIGDEPISDSQRYKMCGNAVTVNVVEAVMKGLLHHAS